MQRRGTLTPSSRPPGSGRGSHGRMHMPEGWSLPLIWNLGWGEGLGQAGMPHNSTISRQMHHERHSNAIRCYFLALTLPTCAQGSELRVCGEMNSPAIYEGPLISAPGRAEGETVAFLLFGKHPFTNPIRSHKSRSPGAQVIGVSEAAGKPGAERQAPKLLCRVELSAL